MKKTVFLLFIALGYLSVTQAQELGYGFKAGLNFSTFDGPQATDANGNTLEDNTMIVGFHIGALINFKFTDLVGLRTELMFSQKGTSYSYNGMSFQDFYVSNQEQRIATTGFKDLSLNVTNAYIDIPITGYFRATEWLEVSGGASVGFLVSSVGAGEINYSGTTAGNTPIDDVLISLEYNYKTDDGTSRNPEEATLLPVGGQLIEIPRTIGAYYQHTVYNIPVENDYFNTVDVGLVAGINIFLNQGLSIGLRANYGLSDVTNNDMDYDLQARDNNNIRFTNDKDNNLSLQASIGFSF